MKKVVFAGCSFTAGHGWDPVDTNEKKIDSPDLWVNLCHKNIDRLNQFDLVNIGVGGGSNVEIFTETIDAISAYGSEIDTLFVQWTSGPRYNFNAGFETWHTGARFSYNYARKDDVCLSNGITWTSDYIQDLVNRLMVLHHLHWEILEIVRLSNIVKNLTNLVGIKHTFFINGLCPWDDNYFNKLENSFPEDYTPFTKNTILEINSKNDEDILKLYNLAHKHYSQVGGINPSDWINLYDSFLQNQEDYNFDHSHPGTNSNLKYYNLVLSGLQNLNYI